MLNALWKITGPWTAKAQFGTSTTTPTNTTYNDVEATAIAIGTDYKLSDTARLFSYYASVKAEGDAAINTEATTDKTIAVGLDFRF